MYFNIPSIYREEIYKRIDEKFDCDWYFEDLKENIKKFDTRVLGHSETLPVVDLSSFYWTKGLIKLLFCNYSHYIMIGATRNLSLYALLLLKYLFFRKKKVLLWTHGFYGKENWIQKNLFKRSLFNLADEVLLYGNYAKTIMVELGFDKEKLHVMHNSLAYAKQLCLRESLAQTSIYRNYFNNDNLVIIMIGRLNLRKKLDLLLQSVALLKNKGKLYNVVFVGDGEDENNLKNTAKSLKIDNSVWFYGACYDEEENARLIFNADACVVPGDIGLTAIHSQMFGCPVFTHNFLPSQGPEFESIKEGITGSFFERDNVISLSNTISNWFENHTNREKIREACYKEIDTQWTPMFQMDVLNKVISL